jgi:hypothetical protein
MAALDLQDLQVCGKDGVTAFMIGNSSGHHHIVLVYPGLNTSNLNVAPMDLLFGTLDFEIFVCCLSVGKGSPLFREDVMVGVLEDFELGEGAVIDNCGVHEDGAGWLLKGREVIIAADCITNCHTAARESLCDVLAQFIS